MLMSHVPRKTAKGASAPAAVCKPMTPLALIREESMVTHVDVDVQQLWRDYRAEPTVELRNQLVERYLSLVKYNAERIWARLPEGVDLDDLISAGGVGLMDAIGAFGLGRGGTFEACWLPRRRACR